MFSHIKNDLIKNNIYYTCNPDKDQNNFKNSFAKNIYCRKMSNVPEGKDQGILWNTHVNEPYDWSHAYKGEVIYPNLNLLNYIAEYNDKYNDSTKKHNLPAITIDDANENINKPSLYLNKTCYNENEIIKDRNMKNIKCTKGIFREENDSKK